MGTTVTLNYREKYKHLFRPKKDYVTVCTIRDEIETMLNHFNRLTNKFYADNRILIEGVNGYLPRHGIIIEHQGKEEEFENDFNTYLPRIEQLADKLDKRTNLYEGSFKDEFCNIDRWVEFMGTKVAYNLSL